MHIVFCCVFRRVLGLSLSFPPSGGASPSLLSQTSAARVRGEAGKKIPGQIQAAKAEKKGITSAFSV